MPTHQSPITQRDDPFQCVERVSGPYGGMYLAEYAFRYEDAFYGYAKICLDKPRDVWSCTALAKISSAIPAASAEIAMLLASQRGRAVLRALAAADEGLAARG